MLEKIFEYLMTIIARWPRARPAVAFFHLMKRKLRHFLNAHPIVAICALAGVGILVVLNVLPEGLRPDHKCYAIEADHQELYGADGDTLQFSADRPCEHRQAIAIEFFNDSTVRLNDKATPIDLVSAGIFIKETARNIPALNQWHEFTVFKAVNNFSWSVAPGPAIFQGSFLKDGCGYDATDISTRDRTETRQGLLLRSEAMRSNPRLDRDTWRRCNYGSTPDQPDYKICDYVYIEFFIPTIAPERWCVKNDLWDKWFAPGTKKVILANTEFYDELRILAQNRWVEGKVAPVPREHWNKLSKGMPKICMRWKGPKEEWLGELSYWQEFASVGAIWCDY